MVFRQLMRVDHAQVHYPTSKGPTRALIITDIFGILLPYGTSNT